jgi:hypothetical protein
MKRMLLYLFLGTIVAGVVCAVDTETTGTLATALPQPSTILICAAASVFFLCTAKKR